MPGDMKRERLDTHQKALQINLDGSKYGTFAEIGAGQEVARWFFRVGGAAGTVAKSMSAYDMTVSDAIYGPADRYVSRQRLVNMLDHEFGLLVERLGPKRGRTTRFFAFANTVAARSYRRSGEAHGWLGMRFQHQPDVAASQILIHVRMLDRESVVQQEALGVIGVNLVHAALYSAGDIHALLQALLDHLGRDRLEVDMAKVEGPAFGVIDPRALSLQLVQLGLTEATLFTATGESVQAAEVLYRKPILVVRGSFRPITNATLDLIEKARCQFAAEPAVAGQEVVVLTEMTLRHLAEDGQIQPRDFLDRAETLGTLGLHVLVSNYARYFRLAAYLVAHNKKAIGIAMGVRRLREMFDESYYTDLDGGILEAFGRMFKNDLRLYIYPALAENDGARLTAANLDVAPHLRHLLAHLLENRHMEDLRDVDDIHLHVLARDVLDRIRSGERTWESLVPPPVVRMIRERGLFGHV
jgi:hypothetical protein